MFKSIQLFVHKYGFTGLITYFKLKLGFTKKIRLRGVNGVIQLRPNSSDIAVFKHIFVHDDYNLSLDFEPGVIVDAGANIGLASIYFANKFPKARIVAIELSKSNFALLERNTINFPQIQITNSGLWHKKEVLHFNEENIAPWGYRVDNTNYSITSCEVDSLTVDELLDQFEIKTIDLFKIDIEGAEHELFSENFATWLPKVKVIVIEFHDRMIPGSSARIRQIFEENSFKEVNSIGENFVFINQVLA